MSGNTEHVTDPLTLEMLSLYREATPAVRKAFFTLIQRLVDWNTDPREAALQFFLDAGLSESHANWRADEMIADWRKAQQP
jgi:hypothetical protein